MGTEAGATTSVSYNLKFKCLEDKTTEVFHKFKIMYLHNLRKRPKLELIKQHPFDCHNKIQQVDAKASKLCNSLKFKDLIINHKYYPKNKLK